MLTANKRIAKNTLLLYIRMFIMMGVSLYTSRVVLQKLGVDDFGLYNIVGGVVVLFSVFNSSLAGSTQRFLNYEMGREDVSSVNKVFQCSIMLHVILCVILIILAETIGLWYINTYLNVPLGRYDAASIVYQLSVLTFCINVLRVPFNACIIAHEKMDFYAYVSVAEAGLKLIVAFMLTMCDFDRLILYSVLILFRYGLFILYKWMVLYNKHVFLGKLCTYSIQIKHFRRIECCFFHHTSKGRCKQYNFLILKMRVGRIELISRLLFVFFIKENVSSRNTRCNDIIRRNTKSL